MPKTILNYRPDVQRRIERPLKRLLDEAKTCLSRPNSWHDDDDDDDDDYTWRAPEIYWTWHGYQTYQYIQDDTLHIILQEKYCIYMSTSFSD